MYRTCLYCNRDMGVNEVVETLPIGRRIAFDAAQGRLWVVCCGCEKWNLVPFDTRLETIEACERLFRGTRMRYSTDNIGIARMSEGLELVRVGKAERPEFAAWRYGDQFGRRRKRAAVLGAAGVAAMVGFYYVGSAAGASFLILPHVYSAMRNAVHKRAIAARIPVRDGVGGAVSRADMATSMLIQNFEGQWGLLVAIHPSARGHTLIASAKDRTHVRLWGQHAVEAVGRLLPHVNAKGGTRSAVQSAVILVESHSMDGLFNHAYARRPNARDHARRRDIPEYVSLPTIHPTVRLALEMAAHEDTEREALAGELKLLERQWREAEELAAISDSLALPESADEDFERLKQQG